MYSNNSRLQNKVNVRHVEDVDTIIKMWCVAKAYIKILSFNKSHKLIYVSNKYK